MCAVRSSVGDLLLRELDVHAGVQSVAVAVDGVVAGVILLQDQLREDAGGATLRMLCGAAGYRADRACFRRPGLNIAQAVRPVPSAWTKFSVI